MTTLILGTLVMLVLGGAFGYIASGTWPKGAAAKPAAPARKPAPKRAAAKRKTVRKKK